MRQDQLTKESEQCDHGYYFGTTCEKCELALCRIDLEKANKKLAEIVALAEKYGWNGVENSKVLKRFLEGQLQVAEGLRRETDRARELYKELKLPMVADRQGYEAPAIDIISALHAWGRDHAEIDAAWFGIEHGWDIESRAELEKDARTNGFKYGLAQAIHHIWKRNVQFRAVRNVVLDEAVTELRLRAARHQKEGNVIPMIVLKDAADAVEKTKTSEAPATTFRALWDLASTAIHYVHAFLQKRNDEWWQHIYRHQCEIGIVVDGRIKYMEREAREAREKETDGDVGTR